MRELYFFDPNETVSVLGRSLPHWSQAGCVCFITFRVNDSLPKSTLERFHADRRHWLRCHGVNPDVNDWRDRLQELEQPLQREFFTKFSTQWHRKLDAGYGDCLLSRPELSKIVAESLLHFDGDRYEITDFVVMPNHVHVLVAFEKDDEMLTQCESWKRYTATQINRATGCAGRFWQQDGFDHLVRSVEQFEYFQNYIANNSTKANLKPESFYHYSK